MLKLLRSDLYRALHRGGGMRGCLIAWVVIMLGVCVAMKLVPLLNGENGTTWAFSTSLDMYGMLALITYVFMLVAAIDAVHVGSADLASGFVRSVVPTCGKVAYYAEKLVLAFVIPAVMLVLSILIISVGALVTGVQVYEWSSPLDVLAWAALVVFLTGSVACLGLSVAWALKNGGAGKALVVLICLGIIESLVGTGVMFAFPTSDVAIEAVKVINEWCPTNVYSMLCSSDLLSDLAGIPEMGGLTMTDYIVKHVLGTGGATVAVSVLLTFLVGKRREL